MSPQATTIASVQDDAIPTFADVLSGFSGSVSSPAAAAVTRWQLLFMDNNPHVEKTK